LQYNALLLLESASFVWVGHHKLEDELLCMCKDWSHVVSFFTRLIWSYCSHTCDSSKFLNACMDTMNLKCVHATQALVGLSVVIHLSTFITLALFDLFIDIKNVDIVIF